jgi:hypothetical protein
MPSKSDIEWFKREFAAEIEPALSSTAFSVDMLTAIACQETGYIWARLRKTLSVQSVLELCVGDTIDAKPGGGGRRAFPKNKAELLSHARGDEMFAIARQCLEDIASHLNDFKPAANSSNKFCRGFGIFQYDLQFFKIDPDYFLQRRWRDFAACLGVAVTELKDAQKKARLGDKTTLTDLEMAHVAIAYNTGRFIASKGLKQGFKNSDGKYYGELVYEYLLKAKQVQFAEADEYHAVRRIEVRDRAGYGLELSPRYRVTARNGLRLRGGPGTTYQVLRLVEFGHQIHVLRRDGDWAQVDLQGDGRADGHMHASFLDAI